MVPEFDKIIFDPNTELNTVYGPVPTEFGWHLIYIEQRWGMSKRQRWGRKKEN